MKKLKNELAVMTVLILLSASTLLGAEGPWEPAGLQGNHIWALETSPTGVMLAGTAFASANKIFRSSDYGLTWTEATGLPGSEIWGIEFDPSNESIVYAALNGAGVFKSLDGGASWSWSNLNGQIWQIAVSPTHPGVVYVASQTGGVFKSEDAGDNWLLQDLGSVNNATAIAVDPTDPDIAWAGTPFWGLFKTTNGGLTWFEVNSGLELGSASFADIRSFLIDPLSPMTVYAGEFWNGVFKSLDGGVTWFKPDPSLFATVLSIELSGFDLYIINTFDDDGNPAYRSSDAGLTWEPLPRQAGLSGRIWPRSLSVIPGAVLIGTDPFPNEGGIYSWQLADADADGVMDDVDNCPFTPNPGQVDSDGDTEGDLCDACPGDPAQMCNPGGSTAAEIPADEGGSLQTPDGAVTLDIAPGDLTEDSTLSITEVAPTDPIADLVLDDGNASGLPLATYVFEPDGLEFSSPVSLEVIVDVSTLNRGQRARIDLYLYSDTDADGVEDSYVSLGATCTVVEDPAETFTATCTAELAHLSIYSLIAPLDSDGDEVPDQFGSVADACPATMIPESVPLVLLRVNRFALADADAVFDTTNPRQGRRTLTYSTDDTAGCSCEQIIEALELGLGQSRFGCSNSVMKNWVARVSQ